jgi:hypothetical protein
MATLAALPLTIGIVEATAGAPIRIDLWANGWFRAGFVVAMLGLLSIIWALILFIAHRQTGPSATPAPERPSSPPLERSVGVAIPPKFARPLATAEELGNKTIQGRTVWLSDLLEDGFYVRGRRLIDCLVLGPAVVVAESSVIWSGVTFLADDPTQVFLELTTRNKVITGVTGLADCVFQDGATCMVSFAGTRKDLDALKKQAGL